MGVRARTAGVLATAVLTGAVVTAGGTAWAGDPPGATVTPDTDLVDGQAVTVAGSGWVPGAATVIALCPAGTNSFVTDCAPAGPGGGVLWNDDAGAFSTTVVVRASLEHILGPPTDCTAAPGACVVGIGDNPDEGPLIELPLAFAPPPPSTTAAPATSTTTTGAPPDPLPATPSAVATAPRFTG